ncbi:hypothetical protein M434DRAFT_14247 [Hypoxylon sp. CO27-5]|nr:hypothetical protein M434DRAFT_14247 [Hypoxylon sp. CO27-5]
MLKYVGFPEFVKVLVEIGFLNDEEQRFRKEAVPWEEATQKIISSPSSDEKDLIVTICAKTTFKDEEKARILRALRWLRIFSSEKVEKKMQLGEGGRDLMMLQHKFEVELKAGTKQTRTSTFCEYGSIEPGGYSAMAKIVGIPCAVAIKQVLDSTLSEKGILAPMNGKINNPLIKELKEAIKVP